MPKVVNETTVSHWLPFIVFHPTKRIPSLIYIEITFVDEFAELSTVIKRLRKLINFRRAYLQDLVEDILSTFSRVKRITISTPLHRNKASATLK